MRLVLCALALVLAGLLVSCGDTPATQTPVVITVVVTATPEPATQTPIPPTPVPTPLSKADQQATAAAQSLATQIAYLATAGPQLTADAQVTATAQAIVFAAREAGKTATAEAYGATVTAIALLPTQTPVLLPSFGDTVETLGWRISLAKMTSKKQVDQSDYYYYEANGLYWLLYVDAANLENQSRTLENTIDWVLVDDHDAVYAERARDNPFTFGDVAEYLGRSALNYGVTPRGLTHPVLIFDVAADAKPAYLIIQRQSYARTVDVTGVHFDLQRKPSP